MKMAHIVLAVIVMVIWASTLIAARVAAEEVPGWALITLRMTIIAIILVPFVAIPRGHMAKTFGFSVTMGTMHFGLMFVALERIHAGTAALILQTSVPLALLLALVFFRERFGWRRAVKILISFFGITFLVGEPRINDNLLFVPLALIPALSFGSANLQLRGLGGVNVYAINGWMSVFAIPQMALISWIFETGQFEAIRNASIDTWIAVAHMGVAVAILGHGLWYQIVPQYRTNQPMPFTLLIPFFGVTLGIIILQETLTWFILAGGLITITGVAIILLGNTKNKTNAVPNREIK